MKNEKKIIIVNKFLKTIPIIIIICCHYLNRNNADTYTLLQIDNFKLKLKLSTNNEPRNIYPHKHTSLYKPLNTSS